MKIKLGVNITKNAVFFSALREIEQKQELFNIFTLELGVSDFFSTTITADDERQLDKAATIIKGTLKQSKLLDNDASITMPDEVCSLHILRLPIVSEKEIISAIEFQAEEFIPYPVAQSSFDYQVLNIDEKEQKMSVLVVATLSDIINRIADYVVDMGLYPASIEPESTAFYRLFFNRYLAFEQELMLVLNIGEKSTQSSIINTKNKQLSMTYNFNLGVQFFVKALQNNLNIAEAEAIKQLQAIQQESPVYQKIIAPLVAEYAKEIQKILLVSTEKIGLMPQIIGLYAKEQTNTLTQVFRFSRVLSNIQLQPISLTNLNKTAPLTLSNTIDTTKTDWYIAAIIASI